MAGAGGFRAQGSKAWKLKDEVMQVTLRMLGLCADYP